MNSLRKSITIILLLACAMMHAHTFVDNSKLQSGRVVKLHVAESGVCRLTYDQLTQLGFDADKVCVLGYGGALLSKDFRRAKIDDLPVVPVYRSTTGQMGKNDYILFYAQGPVSWQYDGSRFSHTQNHYSQYGYYFLTDDVEQVTTKVDPASVFSTNTQRVTQYQNYQVFDVDQINLVDMNDNGEGGGKDFYYGTAFAGENVRQTFTFNFPNIVSSENLQINLKVASSSSSSTTFTTSIGDASYSTRVASITQEKYQRAVVATSSFALAPTAQDEQRIQLRYQQPNSSSKGFLDYIEVVATCELKLTDAYLVFSNSKTVGMSRPSLYTVGNVTDKTEVWDITDLSAIKSLPVRYSDGTLQFEADNASFRQFIVVNTAASNFLAATIDGQIENQNLHAISGKEYVIITNEKFIAQAEQLARAHEEMDGLSWVVVTAEQVYNEYSSGTPDATAYRWFMKQLYDRAIAGLGSAPRYLLLFGDGSYDNRHIIATSAPNTLLTYQADDSVDEVKAYSTDDYFGFLQDHEGVSDLTARMAIGVGRFPVNTITEAQELTDKTIRYMQNKTLGQWKSQLCFLADDGDHGLHTVVGDYAAENLRLTRPDYVVNKIYLDSYQQEVVASGEVYPLAKLKLHKLLNNGVLFFDYSGHGGYNNITSEAVLTANDIRQMHNENMGVWMLATCGFACYDARKTSASEYAVLNPYGGAVAVISACRTVYASDNKIINRHFCDSLFSENNQDLSIADALRIAKNKTGSQQNKLAFMLLGDPALRLAYPDKYKVVSTTEVDTLKALSTAHIEGQVVDKQNSKLSSFNGKVHVTVFDKMQELETLDNDEKNPDDKTRVKFNDYPNIIFNGAVDVKNGAFDLDFMVPIDIRYNYGQGRITFYAYDETTADEAIGYTHQVVVGGSSNAQYNDTVGPEINIYLNTPNFVNGGEVGTSATFFATLQDEQGINTAGSGIGHDLLLVIDNDPSQTYILNDYFRSVSNSFRQGELEYLMSDLSVGRHELMFRAWDLLNNSATRTLQFVVVDDLPISLYKMKAYPNPVNEGGVFHVEIEHDQPQAIVTTTLNIYETTGRLVATETNVAVGEAEVALNLAHTPLDAGIYIYSVLVDANGVTQARKTGKLLVIKN